LGLLIPPSLYFIIYGLLTEQSISRLYAAGLLPGLVTVLMLMVFVGVLALLRPQLVPAEREPITKRDLLLSLPQILPTIGLIALVLGVIYMGVTTVTEAAAIGMLGALILLTAFRRFNWRDIKTSLFCTVRISGMIMFIMMASMVLSNIIGYLGIPAQLARMVTESVVFSPGIILLFIIMMYLLLGMFLDGMAMLVLTLPVVFPVIIALGFDPIWFGVVLAILIEIGQDTPPLGFGIYVLQNASGLPLEHIVKWQLPFIGVLLLSVLLLYFFPQIALYLPATMD
jgi:tripartite ATP-independent transporter DctM subunit